MRRVLFVLYYFPPSGGPGVQRGLKFIRYLPEFGWQPIVLTVRESAQFQVRDESLMREIPAGLIVRRTRCPEFYWLYRGLTGQSRGSSLDITSLDSRPRGPLQRLLRELRGAIFIPDGRMAWKPFAIRAGMRLIREHAIDAIVSSGPPFTCHVIARALHQRTGRPWVADYRDPWTQATFYPPRPSWARAIDSRLESAAIHDASRSVFVGDGMAAEFCRRYPDVAPRRFAVIPNGYDESDFEGVPYERPSLFRITHTGSVFPGRAPYAFLSALENLMKEDEAFARNARLAFAGRLDSDLEQRLRSSPFDAISELPGYLPHAESVRLLRRSALLLLLLGTDAQSRSMLTGKLFEYLASGVSILALGPTDGDAANVIARAGAGWTLEPSREDEIRARIATLWREFRAAPQNEARPPQFGLQRDEELILTYSRRALTERLARLLDEASAGASRG